VLGAQGLMNDGNKFYPVWSELTIYCGTSLKTF